MAPIAIIFFAYPSRPNAVREPAARAVELLASTGVVDPVSWEELKVGGKFIIDEITSAIARADVIAPVVTLLNENVMFETGFAIGSDRPIWPLLDTTIEDSERLWEDFRVLTTVGYTAYVSGDDIRTAFLNERPDMDQRVLLDGLPLNRSPKPFIFYVKALHRTDAEIALTRVVYSGERRGFGITEADPTEGSVYPLSWYAQQIYDADAVIVHFTPDARKGALVHNARCALVAGLAHGMGRPLLMLAERESYAPIDYRDLLYVYQNAIACRNRASDWLRALPATTPEDVEARAKRAQRRELASELANISLGEDVAERESDRLSDYFIQTYSYLQVLERRMTLFVGRKGTGKTANMLHAAERLRSDRRNLVVVIKPQPYEVEAVLSLLTRYTSRDARSHSVDALWQYLLYTEIARTAVNSLRDLPASDAGADSHERELLSFYDDSRHSLDEDFAIRLERVARVLAATADQSGVEASRDAVAEALHSGELRQLRKLLGRGLQRWDRVAVLIDNLDKGWNRWSDVEELAHLLLGLLSAMEGVAADFAKEDHWRRSVQLTLAAFLRSDIFYAVTRVASEPDKIPLSRLTWEDPEVLRRVIEERYAASRTSDGSELWDKYFPTDMNGRPFLEYLEWRVLPRPRDLLHFCNAAIAAAVDAQHEQVTESDVGRAEKHYSQFALDALRVENGITLLELEDVLTGFLGVPATMTVVQVEEMIREIGVAQDRVPGVVQHLRGLSFLGSETSEGRFQYAEDPEDAQKAAALSGRFAERAGRLQRVQIHPAFRPYLETTGD